MLERFLESIGVQGRLIFVGLLVISLRLELSGNFWLGAIAKIAKTAALVYYIMQQERRNFEEGSEHSRMCYYCCFGLIWTIVVAVVFATLYLIIDREREHIDLDTIAKIGNHTE